MRTALLLGSTSMALFAMVALGSTGCGDDDAGDPCAGVTCGGHGTCKVGSLGAYCECRPGYEPQGLTCVEGGCGNGRIDGQEECDGSDLGGKTCADFGLSGDGLSCTLDCQFDTSGCTGCGNGKVEGAEECDGQDLNGQDCLSLGYSGGNLRCGPDCKFDTSGCTWACGDGACNGNETPQSCPQDCGLQVVSLCAGRDFACAVVHDPIGAQEAVVCWGDNANQKLGSAGPTFSARPLRVPGLPSQGISKVMCGVRHACAVAGSDLYCWGSNSQGQIAYLRDPSGPGAVASSVPEGMAWAGGVNTCYRDPGTGALVCVGDNTYGQIDCGAPASYYDFMPIADGDTGAFQNVTSVAIGGLPIQGRPGFICAATQDGGTSCRGGTMTQCNEEPLAILVPERVVAMSGGMSHACAVAETGNLYCWGNNASGQLGSAGQWDWWEVQKVEGLAGVQAVAAGGEHTCAVDGVGRVSCWGANYSYQLGTTGVPDSTYVPQPVSACAGNALGLIAAGEAFTCVVCDNETVLCWGDNHSGQLGDPVFVGEMSAEPRQVDIPLAFQTRGNEVRPAGP